MGTEKEQAIEVEVVEIDGVAVDPRPLNGERETRARVDWTSWQGRVKHLNARWWPLWLLLGIVVLLVVLVVGACLAVVFALWRICRAIIRGFAGLLSPQR